MFFPLEEEDGDSGVDNAEDGINQEVQSSGDPFINFSSDLLAALRERIQRPKTS